MTSPAPLTRTQMESGAKAVAYRAEQLANIVGLVNFGFARQFAPSIRTVLTNSFVESALVNARALAYFLGPKRYQKDVHFSLFDSRWEDDVTTVTGRIIGVVSEYLAHASVGEKAGQLHPGEWPIPELAVVLVGATSRFVSSLDEGTGGFDVAWFRPSPTKSFTNLMSLNPLATVTEQSNNRKVGLLTEKLRGYLKGQGLF